MHFCQYQVSSACTLASACIQHTLMCIDQLHRGLYKNRHAWYVYIVTQCLHTTFCYIYACITLLQGCGVGQMFKCAEVLAKCGGVCFGDINAPACIECLGDLYYTCKDCFSTMEAIEKQAGTLQEVYP